MTEKQFRVLVVQMLRPLFAFPVENSVGIPGIPDVATTAGWIELKLARWPHRADSLIHPGMRNAQRIWHRRWRRAGGMSWTLTLMADNSWLMHDGVWAAEYFDESTMREFVQNALVVWTRKPKIQELVLAFREQTNVDQVKVREMDNEPRGDDPHIEQPVEELVDPQSTIQPEEFRGRRGKTGTRRRGR